MEFFTKTNAVKLRSHLDKYLVADEEDPETVRQRRKSGGSINARWAVEPVSGRSGRAIRLRSCHGYYLTASDAPFLFGMTGKKVVLTMPGPSSGSDPTIEWEPIRDGFQVRLMTRCGKYLRSNGGTPPWRNSITHDDPHGGPTQNWVLWDVEAVEPGDGEAGRGGWGSLRQYVLSVSSFSSVPEDILSAFGSEESPKEIISRDSSASSSSDQVIHPAA